MSARSSISSLLWRRLQAGASCWSEDILRGCQVKRTGVGSDYRRRKIDVFTGTVSRWEYVEVKAPRSRLTRRQRQERARRKERYVVKIVDPFTGASVEKKYRRGKKAPRRRGRNKNKKREKDFDIWTDSLLENIDSGYF